MGWGELARDERFDTHKKRVTNQVEVDRIVGDYAAKYRRDELFSLLSLHRIPCAPVRDLAEVTNDIHLHKKAMLKWVNPPGYGRIVAARSPLRFADHDLP